MILPPTSVPQPAELLAKFIDGVMKSGAKGGSEEELEGTLDAALVVFRFLSGKVRSGAVLRVVWPLLGLSCKAFLFCWLSLYSAAPPSVLAERSGERGILCKACALWSVPCRARCVLARALGGDQRFLPQNKIK